MRGNYFIILNCIYCEQCCDHIVFHAYGIGGGGEACVVCDIYNKTYTEGCCLLF